MYFRTGCEPQIFQQVTHWSATNIVLSLLLLFYYYCYISCCLCPVNMTNYSLFFFICARHPHQPPPPPLSVKFLCGPSHILQLVVPVSPHECSLSVSSIHYYLLLSRNHGDHICWPLCGFLSSSMLLHRNLTKKEFVCYILCWICSVIFQSLILKDILKGRQVQYNSCFEVCVSVINYADGLISIVIRSYFIIIRSYFSIFVPITYCYCSSVYGSICGGRVSGLCKVVSYCSCDTSECSKVTAKKCEILEWFRKIPPALFSFIGQVDTAMWCQHSLISVHAAFYALHLKILLLPCWQIPVFCGFIINVLQINMHCGHRLFMFD